MSDDNNVQTEETPTRRGRKRTRRNYQKELQDLQSRVDVVVKLLHRFPPGDHGPLVNVAIETLEGK